MISVVSGLLGGGKSYWCVDQAVEHVRAGGIVATNLDLDIDAIRKFLHPRIVRAGQIIKVDAATDPRSIPRGDFRGSGRRRVLVILDEALNWFASTGTAKDERKQIWGEYLRQSDKLGQDVWFVSQNFARAAKWIRELAQQSVRIINLGQVRVFSIPIGRLLRLHRLFLCIRVDLGTHTTCGVSFGLIRPAIWKCYNTAQLWGFHASKNAFDSVAIFPPWRPPLRCWFVAVALLLWGLIRCV